MYSDARKIHLIEAMLKVNNEVTLKELESILKKEKKKKSINKSSIHDFVGIFTHKEADKMRKIIEETCETINPHDWK